MDKLLFKILIALAFGTVAYLTGGLNFLAPYVCGLVVSLLFKFTDDTTTDGKQ